MSRLTEWLRRSRSSNSDYDSVASEEMGTALKTWPLWKKLLLWSGVTLLLIILLAFLAIWVVFPLVFMNTYSLQRFLVFWNVEIPKNADYNHPEKYDTQGAVNFYLDLPDVDGKSTLKIGSWLVVPEKDMNSSEIHPSGVETAARLLQQTDMPVIMLMHGVFCTRAILKFDVPRKLFMGVAVDHRGYGDSEGEPSEDGIVSDSVQIYKWIRKNTKNDIYVWGHSLGAAITAHFVRKLREENIVPKGVIIESAFTSFGDEVPETSIGKIFSWLPYFESTILNPLWNNGFRFVSVENIVHVDCPLLMMHSEADEVIPVKLGRRLADVARTKRDLAIQGSVTYREFPAILGYSHIGIPTDKHIGEYLTEFRDTCIKENKSRG